MIRELGSRYNFPRLLLHAHKSSLGVGSIEPNTFTCTLSMNYMLEIKYR